MNMRTLVGTLMLALVSGAASAVATPALPEPGVIELLAIGAVAAIAVGIRKRRK